MKIFPVINSYLLFLFALLFFSLVSSWGALVYYFYKLNSIGIAISLILATISLIIIGYFRQKTKPKYTEEFDGPVKRKPASKTVNLLLPVLYLIIFAFCFFILFTHQTTASITSPWEVVPSYFFACYGLLTVMLIVSIIKNYRFSIFLIILHYFLSFSAAWVVYKIGYGFDPFIHRATVDLINKNGFVEPKPFYYLGQYGLIIILHKLTNFSLVWLDKLLVPILSALFLPPILFKVFRQWFNNRTTSMLLVLAALAFSFPFFIVTTPQNLAYLFLILLILLGLISNNSFDLIVIYLLALSSLAIHPLAGIPAFLFVFLLTIYHSSGKKIKKYGYFLIFVVAVIILPAVFYFIGKNNNLFNNNGEEQLGGVASSPKFIIPGQENFILNFLYLYGFNIKIIISLLAVLGIIIAWRYKNECRILVTYLTISVALLFSYFLTKALPFNFLIEYERSVYADRILLIIAFFLSPFIFITLYWLIDKVLEQKNKIKLPFLIFFAVIITSSLYFSYPRLDRYFNSRSYSVSETDIKTSHWIEDNASGDYIVLANQQVGAAALQEFGFNHYYKNNIFYYPIPTSSPLYQYYLKMVYEKPGHEIMIQAMDLAGVDEAYFVLNKYWWASPKILEEAKLEANAWQEIDKGTVYVFKYKKS